MRFPNIGVQNASMHECLGIFLLIYSLFNFRTGEKNSSFAYFNILSKFVNNFKKTSISKTSEALN